MERRSPLAVLLLVLLLTMLPLGSAACDVHCGVTSTQLSLVSPAFAKHECCHTNRAALCALSQPQGAMEAAAAHGSQVSGSLMAAAAVALPVDVAPQESAGRRVIDSSPPSSEITRNQMPLRI